ncbi:type II toxin-antitoxin system prevent-host-death family antitoxin [Geminocystis sp. GBBB08]|uniref:type II toxin-antitoxin system Phd/YefM family antitoxin n=1 Tax=Geminocystis sp. GBBB08 TaxID=2604140 RepID=UPI0027E2E337|nr:type II toxin-antitoxin system prevent-host-death family antitoxin [Geminocystis sp. GBBB08]MBL1209719.1 type II toxin-antitoxin system prevent-host-death family antitoxin [Geminocystis sp. GBBB08]
METIKIDQAVLHINQLLEIVAKGKDIIITKNYQPLVKLSSIKQEKKRSPLFGSDKDIIAISDDFDQPLDDFQEYI